jgi:hypothetical protein
LEIVWRSVRGGCGRTITLNVPKLNKHLLADNGVLLHEMCHQCLFERGDDPAHTSPGWRNEIMRLHHQITGATIWAGRSTTARRKMGGLSKVVRINKPNADTGQLSLRQGEIARWPNSCGISLGELGRNAVLEVAAGCGAQAPFTQSNPQEPSAAPWTIG